MSIKDWFAQFRSHRSQALSFYRKGMIKAKRKDPQGAIADYTSAIGMPDAPADVVSMALFNRGLVHVALGELAVGTKDLMAVERMPSAPENVKAMARQKLIRMRPRAKFDSADDFGSHQDH